MSNLFFTSDLHLGHINIVKHAHRPFADVDEMNETIVQLWNDTVGHNDTTIIVGDVCMGIVVESLEYVKQLNGTKILVPGNHDRVWPGLDSKQNDKFRQHYQNAGLLITAPQITVRLHDLEVLVCHFPYTIYNRFDQRYLEWAPKDEGGPLIHGHVHTRDRLTYNGTQVHVGLDAWNYTPVHSDQVYELFRSSF